MIPKILIISNNCLSDSDSNGRTLKNFLLGLPKEKLAQFYIQNSYPDFDCCHNYFRVTDKQALKSLISKKINCEINLNQSLNKNDEIVSKSGGITRNALTMIIRNIIWNLGVWKKNGFNKWVNDVNPDIILLQAGDLPYMYKLSYKLSQKYHAKLVIYNSEGYYFKKYDYFKGKGIPHLLYPIFHRILCKNLEKAYLISENIIYNNELLKHDYDEKFKSNSLIIYTSSTIKNKNLTINKNNKKKFIISYCGNLGINRHKSLIVVAENLQKISKDLFIDVYGKLPNKEVKDDFEKCKGIKYHGIISYEEVKKVISNSNLLLHVESFEPFYIEDLKYAFSTKIADSLSSGIPFLLYAPSNLACTEYIKNNDCGHVIENEKYLGIYLRKIVNDEKFCKKYINNALKISERNHDYKKNKNLFQNILAESNRK